MPYQADCDSAGGLRAGAFQPLLCGEARKLASGKLGERSPTLLTPLGNLSIKGGLGHPYAISNTHPSPFRWLTE
jgi:hypothetical protein